MFPERLSFNVLTKMIKVEKRNTFPVNYRFTLDAHGFTSMRYEVIAFKEPFRKDLTVTETKITSLVSCSIVPTTSSLIKEIQDTAPTSLENQKSSTIMKEKQGTASTAYTSLTDLLSPTMMRKKRSVAVDKNLSADQLPSPMIREQHGVAVADNPLADELSSSEFTRQQEGIAEAETSLANEVPLHPMMRVARPDTDTEPTPTPPAAQLSPPSMIKENKGIALSYTPLEDQLPSTMTKVIATTLATT